MDGRGKRDPAKARDLEELVTRAAAGDRGAQNRLFREYWSIIRGAVATRLKEAVGAIGVDDITQEAAVKVLARLPTYRGKNDRSFVAWIRAIAESTLLDSLKRQRALKRGQGVTGPLLEEPPGVSERSMESQVHDARRIRELGAELLRLRTDARTVLVLRRMGYSCAEIGHIVGCSAEAARKRIARATKELHALGAGAHDTK